MKNQHIGENKIVETCLEVAENEVSDKNVKTTTRVFPKDLRGNRRYYNRMEAIKYSSRAKK